MPSRIEMKVRALETARDLIRTPFLAIPDWLDCTLEITDETGTAVLSLPFPEALDDEEPDVSAWHQVALVARNVRSFHSGAAAGVSQSFWRLPRVEPAGAICASEPEVADDPERP